MTKKTGKPSPLLGDREAQTKTILKLIAKAGEQGITRAGLAKLMRMDPKTVGRRMPALAGKIYVASWPLSGSRRFPAYAIGNLPDVPCPAPTRPRSERCPQNVEKLMHVERESAHARWAAGWAPHPDPAAAWLRAAA